MTNILYTIETHGPGGAEQVLVNIADQFKSIGFNPYGYFIEKGWIVEQFKKNGFNFRYFPNKYTIDFPLLINLAKFISNNNIKLIHAHEFSMGFYSVLAAKLNNIPCVITVHGKSEYFLNNKYKKIAYEFAINNSCFICVSYNLREWICEQFKNINDITVINNGIDYNNLRNKQKASSQKWKLLEEFNLPKNEIIISSVGRLYHVKGQIYLIDAAEIILKDFPNTHFVFAGGGPDLSLLKSIILEKKLNSNITFLGESDRIADLLSITDIFVSSSLSEGLSMSILEAMASKLPIVATRVGDNERLLIDGLNDCLVEAGNVYQLSDKIKYFLKSQKLRCLYGKIAYNTVVNHFSMDSMIKKYKAIYDSLL